MMTDARESLTAYLSKTANKQYEASDCIKLPLTLDFKTDNILTEDFKANLGKLMEGFPEGVLSVYNLSILGEISRDLWSSSDDILVLLKHEGNVGYYQKMNFNDALNDDHTVIIPY